MSVLPAVPIVLALLLAAEPSKESPSRVVGKVYGKAVTAADIGLTERIDPTVKFDARDKTLWNLMGRVMETFGDPVVQRFVTRQKIEATADELQQFHKKSRKLDAKSVREWEARLVKLKTDLAAPNLSADAKAKLEKEQDMYTRLIASRHDRPKASEAADGVARMFIVAWKTERELHRAYGGRVIFQQAGLEALDGRRRLFEQAEKNGDLKFDDPGVRHLFYYYANMKHTDADVKDLEHPWFFDEEK